MAQPAARPEHLDLAPVARVAGTVPLPGSKSISNRTLLLAALAEGTTAIAGLLDSDDTARMLEALRALGIDCARAGAAGGWRVRGCAGVVPVKRAELFLGNAGTAFRPLTAVLALAGGTYRLAGVARMHERPIGDLVDALRCLGADVRYCGKEGFPPLAIGPAHPSAVTSLPVRGDVSSQFLTALLLALPLVGRAIAVEVAGELVSKPYVELTLDSMRRFGVVVERAGAGTFRVPAGARYRSPGTIHVEGDASSASYFLAAGALGGGPVRVQGVGRASVQGDVRFVEVLRAMGAAVALGEDWIEVRGARPLRPIDLDLNHIPDAAMTAAVLALFADGPSVIRNVGSWRVKETDRLAAMATELRKVGAAVEERADALRITPPPSGRLVPGAVIDTYDDHRMAMCFALVALGGVPVRINDPACVNKTFPDYFRALARLTAAA
ncbi:MAG: 3-phosphoshikimate 1-carboxyvinyltransferase [Burkholderiales bacterium]